MATLSSPPILARTSTAPVSSLTRRTSEHRQPRRKVSSNRERRPQELDEGLINSNISTTDAMEDDPILPLAPPSAFLEPFCEKLDEWLASEELSGSEKHIASASLVDAWRGIIDQKLDDLKTKHRHDLERYALQYWERQLQTDPSQLDSTSSHVDEIIDEEALEEVWQCQAEYDTWRLFEDLLSVRYLKAMPTSSGDNTPPIKDYGNDKFAADGESFTEYLLSDSQARERHIVCKWLEESARRKHKDVDPLRSELESWSQRGKGLWASECMHTRERIKHEKRLRIWNTSVDDLPSIVGTDGTLIVQQLDPDAATRLERSIDAQDRSFSVAFWMTCHQMIRQGASMFQLRSFCEECNQYAIAILLGAAFGPEADVDGENCVVGRYRWRMSCKAASAQKYAASNSFQKAIMGLLGGRVLSDDPIWADWQDACHSMLNAHLVAGYQDFVRHHFAALLPPDESRTFGLGDSSLSEQTMNDTIESVKKNKAIRSKASTHSSLAIIQMSVISSHLTKLLVDQGASLAYQTSDKKAGVLRESFLLIDQSTLPQRPGSTTFLCDDPDALRTLVHMFLTLDYLEVDFSVEQLGHARAHRIAQNVCAAYTEYLFNAGKWQLVPMYARSLSPELATHIMAKTMPVMVTDHERQNCVSRMEEYHMDMFGIFDRQTQYALDAMRRDKGCPENTEAANLRIMELTEDEMWPGQRILLPPENEPSSSEEGAIASGEWYTFAPGHWAQTFEALLNIIETFFVLGKQSVAVDLVQAVPLHSIMEIKWPDDCDDQPDMLDEDQDLSPEGFVLKQQCLMFKYCTQLVNAISATWNWRLAEDRHFRESKAGRVDPARLKQSRQDLATALDSLNKAMDPVLMPGFMMFPKKDAELYFPGDDAEDRYNCHTNTLRSIREANLPELVLAYNSALTSAGLSVGRDSFMESLELGKSIADNDELVRCFQKQGRMRELVDGLAYTSKRMLMANEEKHHKSVRRGKTKRTLGIWDIKV